MPEQLVVPTHVITLAVDKSKHEQVKGGREIDYGTSDQDIRQKEQQGAPVYRYQQGREKC
jgi:hypothetical protein